MASATDADIFGETGISPGVSVDSAGFFAQHGIFYITDPEIGRLVEKIDNEGLSKNPEALARCKVQLLRNPHINRILQPIPDQPAYSHTFGTDPGHHFAWTAREIQNEVVVYLLSKGSRWTFWDGSHIGEIQAFRSPNGWVEVPKAFMRSKGLKEIDIRMDQGGVVIASPRLVIQFVDGFSSIHVWPTTRPSRDSQVPLLK
ncbi:hypothetical protein F5B17DRAFT_423333 [Nemania serpens]|nr:hypothetical protein F5B17DRAFT_423333 [Nemania serpens]